MTFAQFAEKLEKPKYLTINEAKYQAYSKPKKASVKQKVGSYFCPSTFAVNHRNDLNTEHISLICLDIDNDEHAQYVDPVSLDLYLEDFNWILYPTLTSTTAKPRYRLIVDADGKVPSEHYPVMVATIAAFINLPEITLESLTPSQPMFMPMRCAEAPYECHSGLSGRPFCYSDIDFEASLLKADRGGDRPVLQSDDDGFQFLVAPVDVTDTKILDALQHLDPDMPHQKWVRIGAALKHQFQHDEDRGYEIWNDWSRRGEKYDSKALDRSWKSTKANPADREPITVRSLFKMARDGGWVEETGEDAEDGLNDILLAIESTDSYDDLVHVIPDRISKRRFTNQIRDILVNEIKKRVKDLHNKAIGLPVLRKACKYIGEADAYQTDEGIWLREGQDVPDWAEDLHYVKTTHEFYNSSNGERLNPEVLDTAFGKYLITKEERLEGRVSPSVRPRDVVTNVFNIPQYYSYVYLPQTDSVEVEFQGSPCVNTYRDIKPRLSSKGISTVTSTIENHLKWILPDPEDQQILLDYLSFCVQFPGRKIKWAILLQGAPGCGKTFFASLIAAALGDQHIGVPDNTVLTKEWTSWAEGKCLVCIEEIRASGKNRYELMDKLKPFISNDVVTINRKFKSEYVIPNVTNYLMFTNHHDALVIDDADRRYCVFRSEIQDRYQIAQVGGEHYFDKLFGILKWPGTIRKYFEEREISKTFKPDGRAPVTRWREDLIGLGKSETEQIIEEIYETPCPWINHDLVSSKILLDTINTDHMQSGRSISRRDLSRVLSNMGFIRQKKRESIRCDKHWLWVHQTADRAVKKNPKQEIIDRIDNYNDLYDEEID